MKCNAAKKNHSHSQLSKGLHNYVIDHVLYRCICNNKYVLRWGKGIQGMYMSCIRFPQGGTYLLTKDYSLINKWHALWR